MLIHGRPVSFGTGTPDFNSPLDDLPALLSAWRPGEEGGSAIVNLLLGDSNPSGKLAQAWQRSAGYIHTPTSPWFQVHASGITGDYFGNGDGTPLSPLFPFSWGLSYTTFNFSALSVEVTDFRAHILRFYKITNGYGKQELLDVSPSLGILMENLTRVQCPPRV